MSKKSPWEKEWNNLLKREARYCKKRVDGPTSVLIKKLDRIIPARLRSTFSAAFSKGFGVLFEKGTWLIEKTYNKKKKQSDFMINIYADELRQNSRSAHRFTRQARGSKFLNLTISFFEGIIMGLFGMAIPDIPLFLAMVLKSVYEVALSFGYDYHDENEKIFILKVIAVAMTDEDEFLEGDRQINEAIQSIAEDGGEIGGWSISKEEQIRETSDSIVREMIYTKFIQQFVIIGLFGGIFDPVYVDRISDYAVLKYRRRFLSMKLANENYERNQGN